MEEDENITDEQQTIKEKRIANLQPYQWKKGQSGNSLGRYMGGLSGKERLKRKIAGMTDEEFEEFLEGMSKIDIFRMAEGNPKQDTDLMSDGKPLQIIVPPQVAEAFNINATNTETSGSNTEQE